MVNTSQIVLAIDFTQYHRTKFRFIRKLGESQFPVWEAIDKSAENRKVAVKILAFGASDHNRPQLERSFNKEVEALSRLRVDKAIVAFLGVDRETIYVDTKDHYPYELMQHAIDAGAHTSDIVHLVVMFVAMEHVDGGSAANREKDGYIEYAKANPGIACKHLASVADGLHIIHELQGHRDIKPANLLWSKIDNALKIADYGLAMLATDVSGTTLSGTLDYLAPEEDGKPHSKEARDVYAFAISIYEILSSDLPMKQTHNTYVKWKEAHGHPDRPDLKWFCPWMTWELSNGVKRGMDIQAERRPTIENFARLLAEEADWLLHRTKPRSVPLWNVELPVYSLETATDQKKTARTFPYTVNPRYRVERFKQHCYWIDITLKHEDQDVVGGLHELFTRHVGPFYAVQLVYGEAGFIVSFWSSARKDLSQLWRELAGRDVSARILRCDDCEVVDKSGKSLSVPRQRSVKAISREEFNIRRDLYHYQCQCADPKYIDKIDVKHLVAKRVLIKSEMDTRHIHGTSYAKYEKSGLEDTAENRRRIIVPEISNTISGNPSILGATYYRQTTEPLPPLPTSGKIKASEAVGAISFTCKTFPSVFLLPKIILQKGGLADTKLFTGWYSFEHDGVTWEELTETSSGIATANLNGTVTVVQSLAPTTLPTR